MKINSTKILRGANFWSIDVPFLLQVDITIENKTAIETIRTKIQDFFPEVSLENYEETNFQYAHMMAQIAVQLQKKAGIDVSYFIAKRTVRQHDYIVVFEYKTENTAELVIEETVALIEAVINKTPIDLDALIESIKSKNNNSLQNEVLLSLIDKARIAQVPVIPSKNDWPYQFGYGKNGISYSKENEDQITHLFQSENKGRIPIIAVTGSNGKTTTTRLIAHVLDQMGQKVGFTTSDGVYVKDKMIDEGDTTGPASAALVLRHPEVEIAILETARGGIVRAGIGFDNCDIAVITNIQEDHLGIADIETIEDLAKVKAVVVGTVKPNGTAVLNANNTYTTQIGQEANCDVAWFSIDKENTYFKTLLVNKKGHLAYVDNNKIKIVKEGKVAEVGDVKDIPITYNGTAVFMVENVLAATLALSVYGIAASDIARHFKSFMPSVEQTPGRMNLFDFNKKKLLVDFAHNPDGFAGIRDFLVNIDAPQKIGIIVGTGDRKDSDTFELGQIAAQMFDVVLIHQIKFLRGKDASEIVDQLVKGIQSENPNKLWQRIPDEEEPLQYALAIAQEGAFITALSNVLDDPSELVRKYTKVAVV